MRQMAMEGGRFDLAIPVGGRVQLKKKLRVQQSGVFCSFYLFIYLFLSFTFSHSSLVRKLFSTLPSISRNIL